MADDEPMCRATNEGEKVFNSIHSVVADDATEKNIVKQIQGTPLDYIGQGDSRVVLLDESGDYLHSANACVVKINKYGDNNANRTEVQNWQDITDEPKRYLMRVTDWDDNYRWVVMPYVDTNVTDEMLNELEKTFIRNGWKVNDVNKRNAARVQDRAVLIDYDADIYRIDTTAMSVEERLALIDWKYD